MSGTMAALIGLATILTVLTVVWVLSLRLQDASVADVCWGLGFVLLAWLYCLLSPTLTPRSWLVAVLITLWGARLSRHIYRRNHGQGEDPRYQAMRASHGPAFWWRSLFKVFWLQGAILWFVALPLLVAVRAAQPACLTAVDGIGGLLFAVGFCFEVVGDRQLRRFRADPRNRGHVLDRGLWRYTPSQLLRRRRAVVGPVCGRRRHAGRMAHRAEPGPDDLLAPACVRGDAPRAEPHVEARLPRVHRPHAGVLPWFPRAPG